MNAFTREFLETQKKKLEEEQVRLEAELNRIAKKDAVGDDYHAQVEQVGRAPDENVVEEEQYEAARSVEQSLELQLRDVKTALARMADGSYGVCGTCGEPIEQKRLEALPSARTCLTHIG
ncbi:MAG: TraR/DksA C4-type zinc finger protein [bacterium]|nr:TraR/DksA C4-type zinc finger protein [bacterium]